MNKSISKNFIFKLILNIFNIVIPVLIGPYLARKLGPDTMGVFNYSQTIFGYFFIFASFGVYQYGIRELSNCKNKKDLSSIFTNLFVISTISNIIVLISYLVLIYYKFSYNELYIPCLILSFNFISNIFYVEWVNEALENYDFISIKTVLVKFIYLILIFIFVNSVNDLNEYMILLGLTTFLNNILSYFYVKKYIKFNFKNLKIKKHLKPMFMVVILANVGVLYTQFDKLIIGKYLNIESVAFYTIAQSITNIVNGLLLTFINVTIPRLTSYATKDGKKEYLSLLNKVTRMYMLVLYPASIGMFVLSKEIIVLYGGLEYLPATSVFSVFSIYIITLGYETILANQVIYIHGRESDLVKIDLIGGILNLLLNILLVKFNLLTESTSIFVTLICNILIILIQYYYIKFSLGIDFKIFNIEKTKYLFISLAFIPITFFIKKIVDQYILVIILTIIFNGLFYFAVLYIIKDEMYIFIFNKIKEKINIFLK